MAEQEKGRRPSCDGCNHAGPHLPTTPEHTPYRATGQCRVFGCLCPAESGRVRSTYESPTEIHRSTSGRTLTPSPNGPYARLKKERGEWCYDCDLPTTQVSGGGFLAHPICPGHVAVGCGCVYDEHDPWCPLTALARVQS